MGRAPALAGVLAAIFCASTQAAEPADAVTLMSDPAGDANGLATVGQQQATAPLSSDPRDLTSVTAWRDADALSIAFHLAAAPDTTLPETFYGLHTTVGSCDVSFYVLTSTRDKDGAVEPPAAATESDECRSLFGSVGFSASVEGDTVIGRFPFAALATHEIPVAPGTVLPQPTADVRQGTKLITWSTTVCDPDCPAVPDFFYQTYLGPLVDAAGPGSDFAVPEQG